VIIEAGSGTGDGVKFGLVETSVEPLVDPSWPRSTLIVVVLDIEKGEPPIPPIMGVKNTSLVPWASGPCKGRGDPLIEL
jgi:hypothetical protein